ncbi:hypothetical protein HanRHA438_Chr02g0085111 [Helianthus annuus]|nr:hypothetical protein HanHA300_Chr02g0061451 [Helianthus annuus]KAJ0619311.1 hypothetical protein HanHA89_Chr02g0069951 [Helianthus annuus]KAJ0940588.1 hypothetical protein HanRHA438_Chr02g0085111 [Helianthus annuus]
MASTLSSEIKWNALLHMLYMIPWKALLPLMARTVFDITLKVHREVQKRDIEAARNLLNWILHRLDKMKPAAQIQAGGPMQYSGNTIRIPSKRLAYPIVSRLLRRQVPVMSNMQRPQLVYGDNGVAKGVIRDDILQWLSHG